MTCADGTKASNTAKNKLELNDQPTARRPRKLTSDMAPKMSAATQRIHSKFCTELVCPYVACSSQPYTGRACDAQNFKTLPTSSWASRKLE